MQKRTFSYSPEIGIEALSDLLNDWSVAKELRHQAAVLLLCLVRDEAVVLFQDRSN